MKLRWRQDVIPLVGGVGLWVAAVAPVQSQVTPVQPFNVVDIGGEVFVQSTYRDENETTGREQTKSEETTFRIEGGVQLDVDAYLYHPNLLDLSGTVRFSLQNETSEFNDEDRDSDGTLLSYNVSALAFREKRITLNAFAHRNETTVNRSFTRSTDIIRQTEGAEMFIKGKIPITLSIEHLKRDEESANREDDEDSMFYHARIEDRRNQNWYNLLEYLYEDVDESSTSIAGGGELEQDLSYKRHNVRYTNRWRWGNSENPHELVGGARYQHRTGTTNEDLLHIFERLDLRHTPTFGTYYEIEYRDDDFEDQHEREGEGRIGFVKNVYDSLDIDGHLRGYHQDIDGSTISSLGGFLDLDYRKRTPLGMFTAFLDLGLEYETQDSVDDLLRILNESHTLVGVIPETLNNPNVVNFSLRVTDATNTLVYIEGVDYIVRRIGSFVEIERLIGGAIADGETVLVDYDTLTAEDADFTTTTIALGQRLDLKWIPVAVYGEFRYRDQSLEAGEDPGNLEKEEILRLGAELRLGPVIVLGEYETRDSRISPSWDMYRAEAHFSHRVTNNVFFTANGRYENKEFTDGLAPNDPRDNTLETLSATANINTRITNNLMMRLEASYYDRSGRDNDNLARVGGSLEWRYGRMDVSLDAFYEQYEQEENDGDRVFVGVNVSRSF